MKRKLTGVLAGGIVALAITLGILPAQTKAGEREPLIEKMANEERLYDEFTPQDKKEMAEKYGIRNAREYVAFQAGEIDIKDRKSVV